MTKEDEEEEEQQNQEEYHDDDEEEADAEAGTQGINKDSFFESFDRVPSGISFDVDLHSSDSESDDDVRFSFASAVAPPSFRRLTDFDDENLQKILKQQQQEEDHGDYNGEEEGDLAKGFDYGIWMAEPMSIKERRRKLLQGMGLASSKNMPLPVVASSKSRKIPPNIPLGPSKSRLPSSRLVVSNNPVDVRELAPSPLRILARSRSDTHLALPDLSSFAGLFRVSSAPPSQWRRWVKKTMENAGLDASNGNGDAMSPELGVLKIKNLDTGKEFVVSSDGAIGKLNDPQTGLQFTMDEFEKFLGFSPIVKEVMRRVTDANNAAIVAASSNIRAFGSKSRGSKSTKKKVSWLKNIKFVASTVTGLMSEKERERESIKEKEKEKEKEKSSRERESIKEKEKEKEKEKSSERLKVHQHGKSYKELTGLYMCQEIQAHQGSIWTMKFSCDSRYLASAGEDRVVHIWQVVECDTMTSSLRRQDQPQTPSKQPPLSNGGSAVVRSSRLAGHSLKRTKKGKGSSLPDYIVMPETIFSLSSEPFCSFDGHLDDILDLSWSKSQCLLSSSMDKTVRLWDIETKACLKLFAHNDYVTCIQFNPTDERYFISGSLDAKVRIWNIPDRQVVDWSDLHEMVTAACYTPDGQGALVGSHKGSCRFYNTTDAKLSQEGQIDIRTKKKKSSAKKITGFQFAPDNTSEVLITSADSQIRIFDGVDMIHKFRGFRNISSQISASCTMDGKYVVCASEDSHVYIWKRDRSRTSSGGKSGKITTRSHEHFFCKDVSVAIPWPNGATNCEPSPDLPSWSRRHNDIRTASNLEDMFPSGRSQENPEDINNDVGSSSFAGHSSVSSSSSSLSSWGWGGGSNRITTGIEAANAWGLVVVTAGLGGNIRIYQNFGLPVRLSRQANLF